MTLKFKVTINDFLKQYGGIGSGDSRITINDAVMCVDKLFDKWLSEQQVVYGYNDNRGAWTNGDLDTSGTHKARLVCIEEIAPAKCEHKHVRKYYSDGFSDGIFPRWRCENEKCNKELEPIGWREK